MPPASTILIEFAAVQLEGPLAADTDGAANMAGANAGNTKELTKNRASRVIVANDLFMLRGALLPILIRIALRLRWVCCLAKESQPTDTAAVLATFTVTSIGEYSKAYLITASAAPSREPFIVLSVII